MSLLHSSIRPMAKTLEVVPKWLESAQTHAESAGFDADLLVDTRLAPTQFSFVRQVQAACDTLKLACARLTGVEAPKHDDSERTLAELTTRVEETLAFVQGLDDAAFEGAETKSIAVPFAKGMVASGEDYVLEFSLPNFYFHVSHAYALLRHNGVPLGKRDFIGSVNLRPAE